MNLNYSYDNATYLRMAKFCLNHSDYDKNNPDNINQLNIMIHKRVTNYMTLNSAITEKKAIVNVVTEIIDGFSQPDFSKYYDSLLKH